MKLKKQIAVTLCCLSLAALLAACETNSGNNNTTPTPASTTDVKNETTKQPDSTQAVTPADNGSKNDTTPTADPVPSPDATTPDVSPSPTSEADVSPTAAEAASKDAFNRKEFWANSYLVWLPAFEAGTAVSKNSTGGTYDYITISDVTAEDITSYISALKKSGFTENTSESNSNGVISFSADNYNSWNAVVSYDGSSLVIGSGFREKDSSKNEAEEKAYKTTLLQYIPRFENGSFSRYSTSDDETMNTYAIYENVSSESVSAYIGLLKNAGYIYGVDEGDDGSVLWYIALNEENFECSVEFDGSIVKIGCSKYIDD